MNVQKKILNFIILVTMLLNCSQAKASVMSTFPNLYLKSDDKEQVESFKKSNTTTTLYYRYQAIAKAMDTGDREACKKILAGYIAADTEYWKAQATKPLNLPDKPNVQGKAKKAAIEHFRDRVESLEKEDARRKAVANTYLQWVSVEIPNWVRTLEGKPLLPGKSDVEDESSGKKSKEKTNKTKADDE